MEKASSLLTVSAHGYLEPSSVVRAFDAVDRRLEAIEKSLEEIKNPADLETGESCCICLDPLVHVHRNPLVRPELCSHMYHRECGTTLLTTHTSCPLCRLPINTLYKVDHPNSLRGLQLRHRQAARNRSASAGPTSAASSTHRSSSGSPWPRWSRFRRFYW